MARVSTGTSPQQGVHSEPDSSQQHGGRFLEDDLGTQHTHRCPSARHTLPGRTHGTGTHILHRTYALIVCFFMFFSVYARVERDSLVFTGPVKSSQ